MYRTIGADLPCRVPTLRSLIEGGHYELAAYRLLCGVLAEAWKADGREPLRLSTLNAAQAGGGSRR